jgi:hypothetical protein
VIWQNRRRQAAAARQQWIRRCLAGRGIQVEDLIDTDRQPTALLATSAVG